MIGAMLAGVIAMALLKYGYVSNEWIAGGIGIGAALVIMSVGGKVRVDDGRKS